MQVGDRVRITTTGETATVIEVGTIFSQLRKIELDSGEWCYVYVEHLMPIHEVPYDPVRRATRSRMRRHIEDGRPL